MFAFSLGVFAVLFSVGQGPWFFAFGDEGGEAAVGEASPETLGETRFEVPGLVQFFSDPGVSNLSLITLEFFTI